MNVGDALDNFLHVYGQYSYHDEAVIRGTRTALLQLRESIDDALENGISGTELFATDGEGYELRVVCVSTIAAVGKPEYRVDDVHEIEERRRERAAKLSAPCPSWDSDVVILPRSEVEAIRETIFEEVAQWHDKNARICLEVSKDEPRMNADDRMRAHDAYRHHAASAAGIRNKLIGERRAAIRSLKSTP